MRRLMARLVRWWRGLSGFTDCPACLKQTLRWEKDYVFHPEEPPCFGHWECHNPECRVQSDIEASPLMDEAARKHGYKDFRDFAQKKDQETS